MTHVGRLRTLARPELVSDEVERFLRATAPERGALAAVGITAGLWLVAVPGSGGVDVERSVPVHVYDLPDGYVLNAVDPPEVAVTLHGRRRDLLLLDDAGLEVRVHAYLVNQGRRTFAVEARQVGHPPAVGAVAVRPTVVEIDVAKPTPEVREAP